MTPATPTSTQLAVASVGLTVGGMLAGTILLLATDYTAIGWLVFTMSFGGWLGAALLGLREGWHRGWFDR